MINLYFRDIFSMLTILLVLINIIFIVNSILGHQKIKYWGRRILLFVFVGTTISGLAAVRDAYMTEKGIFNPEGMQSNICSISGALIFLLSFISIFIKNQKFRKAAYFVIAILFILQVLTIEMSRIFLI